MITFDASHNFCNIILFKLYKNFKLNDEQREYLRINKSYLFHLYVLHTCNSFWMRPQRTASRVIRTKGYRRWARRHIKVF